ncbi:MAG: DUF1207 domain-containing protein [Pirellulaceae bacterium]|jgi:hypothetical protein|nr:DUF1207 domain-containing protein [Pirellulaceae bacterium]
MYRLLIIIAAGLASLILSAAPASAQFFWNGRLREGPALRSARSASGANERVMAPSRIEPISWEERNVVGEPVAFDWDRHQRGDEGLVYEDEWHVQILPEGLVYRPYLAVVNQPRFSAHIVGEKDDGWLFDAALGSQVGLWRWGTLDNNMPEGWQIDAEGVAFLRLDIPENLDVRSADFRAGVPVSYACGRHRTRFGYYHLSSHLADEFLLKNPGFPRLNYSRDVLLLGHSFYFREDSRIYGEAGWAFKSDVSKEWEFILGLERAPVRPTGIRGAPFYAVNVHLREEVDFGGTFTAQAGWAWRGDRSGRLLRMGVHYLNGKSPQFSFFNTFEHQIGFGVWYDF